VRKMGFGESVSPSSKFFNKGKWKSIKNLEEN